MADASEYVKKCLKILDDHLLHHMYLVGERITQADVACAAALLLAYQVVRSNFWIVVLIPLEMLHKYANLSTLANMWFTLVAPPFHHKHDFNSSLKIGLLYTTTRTSEPVYMF